MFENWANVPVNVGYHLCLPTLPGVYLFVDGRGVPVYVGQAENLRERHKCHHAITKALVDCGSYANLAAPSDKGDTFIKGFRVYWELCEEANLLHREFELFRRWSSVGGCELNVADPEEQLTRRVSPAPSQADEEVTTIVDDYLGHVQERHTSAKDDLGNRLIVALKTGLCSKDDLGNRLIVALKTGLWRSPHNQNGYQIYKTTQSKTLMFTQEEPVEYTHLQERLTYHEACQDVTKRLIESLKKEYIRGGAMVEVKEGVKCLNFKKLK